MASSLNKAQIIGNLGRDPEVRRLGNGDPVVNLRIATSESWRDKQSGERKERTEWHSVVIFNEALAKFAEQYLKKGSKVYVEGKLTTRKWNKDGQDHYSTEIHLGQFNSTLLSVSGRDDEGGDRGSRSSDDRGGGSGGGGGGDFGRRDAGGFGSGSAASGRSSSHLDDDIPF